MNIIQQFKTLGNPLNIPKLTKNLKRFVTRVNEKFFAEICKGNFLIKRNGKCVCSITFQKSVFWPILIHN